MFRDDLHIIIYRARPDGCFCREKLLLVFMLVLNFSFTFLTEKSFYT